MKRALKIIGLIIKLSLAFFVVSILYVASHQDSYIMSGVVVTSIATFVVLVPTYVVCSIIKSFMKEEV